MNEQEIREGVAARSWFHNIELPYGIVTPGYREKGAWEWYGLPARLDGKKVLDVGSWDGGFAFEAERRGAKHVTAIDIWDTTDSSQSLGKGMDNFLFCHRALESRVHYKRLSVYDVSPVLGGFDLVICLQLLYHLHHPLVALQKLARVTLGTLVLETVMEPGFDQPAMFFYKDGFHGDRSNHWKATDACIADMGASVGFTVCEKVWQQHTELLRACFHLRSR